MFLQYIQSQLEELGDISGALTLDTSALSKPVSELGENHIEDLWKLLVISKKKQLELTQIGQFGNRSSEALVMVMNQVPHLRRFVSSYDEEDFYI